MNDQVCIFVEATLSQDEIRQIYPNAVVKPSIKMGDVLLAIRDKFETIVIIDGVFGHVPSVWHKEILYAVENNITVIGCSSMGALRASEMHTCGMLGYGKIFESYINGVTDDDSEVAVSFITHMGQVYSTIPLINVRLSLSNYPDCDVVLDKVRKIHYTNRNWDMIKEILTPPEYNYLHDNYIDYKKQDAVCCLRELDKIKVKHVQNNEVQQPSAATGKTLFFKRLYQKTLYDNQFDFIYAALEKIGFVEADIDNMQVGKDDYELAKLMQLNTVEQQKLVAASLTKIKQAGITITQRGFAYLIEQFRIESELTNGNQFKQWVIERNLDLSSVENTFKNYFLIRKFIFAQHELS